MDKTKFRIGDKVKIINYGSLIWCDKDTYRKGFAINQAYEKAYLKSLLTGSFEVEEYVLDETIKPKNLISEDEKYFYYDISPEVVGQIGIISKCNKTQGIDQYSLEGIKGKCSWYNNNQLELINKNPNNES